MSRRGQGLVAALLCAAALGRAAEAPVSIVRIVLGPEEEERQPVVVPTEPDNTVEIDLPAPVTDWAGRGFTPDPDRFAGDFVIQATRGRARLFVTPVTAEAHRVLHVVLAEPGGGSRGLPLEFVPAPAGLAWRKVVFSAPPAAPALPPAHLLLRAPRSGLREPGPEAQLGLVRTLRMLLATTGDEARNLVAANPALALATFQLPPRSFGDFTIANRFALRDATTGSVGLCVSVANQTARRLLFEPGSWVVRAGDRVYPIRTVDFANELEPGASAPALLVLARGPDGDPTGLLAANDFEPSVVLGASVNPRPVRRLALEGPEER